uniref:Uncharacterized protein n=1 Tax=Dulem virus 38 TaxID=3145756 RepID=A0AAU8B1K1_9CAUD
MSNYSTDSAETFYQKIDRITAELADVLADALGPASRPGPAEYSDHRVTVRDGRVKIVARISTSGRVLDYSAYVVDRDSAHSWATCGPVRRNATPGRGLSPSLVDVLPLVTMLEAAEKRLGRAQAALEGAGRPVSQDGAPDIVLYEPRAWGQAAVARVKVVPETGALAVTGRDASEVRRILEDAGVF